MLGLGWGEIGFIAIVAMLLVGPNKLPQYAAQGAKWMRELRTMLDTARSDLVASAGIDESTLSSLSDLNPKRLASSFLEGETASSLVGLDDESTHLYPDASHTTPTARVASGRTSSAMDPDAT